ncbi:MAG: hypothetical protein KC713_03765, partial [Candidatus Omnitrophica bacterium]|nr:hypothetical protein [Candidatus Omnitrophota bacterium]
MRILLLILFPALICSQELDSLKSISGTYLMSWADTLTTGDPVSTWGNAVGDGAGWVQSNATKRAALLIDTLYGHSALELELADYYQSGENGDYNFLHNGTGGTILLVMQNPHYAGNAHFLGTGENSTQPGFLIKFGVSVNQLSYYLYNGSATIINGQGLTLDDTTPTWHIMSFVVDDSLEIKIDDGNI